MLPDWSAAKARHRPNSRENLDIAFMLVVHAFQPTDNRLEALTNPNQFQSNFLDIAMRAVSVAAALLRPQRSPAPDREPVRSVKPRR
jgi:hypothetical protein